MTSCRSPWIRRPSRRTLGPFNEFQRLPIADLGELALRPAYFCAVVLQRAWSLLGGRSGIIAYRLFISHAKNETAAGRRWPCAPDRIAAVAAAVLRRLRHFAGHAVARTSVRRRPELRRGDSAGPTFTSTAVVRAGSRMGRRIRQSGGGGGCADLAEPTASRCPWPTWRPSGFPTATWCGS